MNNQSVKTIKRSQKESQLYRIIAQFFLQILQENSRLQGLMVYRVQLGRDKSVCTVFFYTPQGAEYFEERLSDLVLYKASLRSAIAKIMPSRYVPELVFKYDKQFEKQLEVEQLLDKIKAENQQ